MIKIFDLRTSSKDKLIDKILSRNLSADKGMVDNIEKRVQEILNNVRINKDKAVFEYTLQFDKCKVDRDTIRVQKHEIESAYKEVSERYIETVKLASKNIEEFHLRQKENSWFMSKDEGVILGQMVNPLEVAGIYVPGGKAAYPSSVLMNAIPAKIAGVNRIIMTTPPNSQGKIPASILVAASESQVDEIYKVGGAQAICAMAFGTESIPRVDKIVGPGNIYVATAKKLVYGYCNIDMIAGPSEILVIADETANPRFIAADLLSQAEHDVLATAILLTTSEALSKDVIHEINAQVKILKRKEIIKESLRSNCVIIISRDLEECIEIANRFAPEHLELSVSEPFNILGQIKNAGAIFLGHFTPESVGDYLAGPNHVLPTNGTARFHSPLGVYDFVKRTNVISYTKNALNHVLDEVSFFAETEGLDAHSNAIKIRGEYTYE